MIRIKEVDLTSTTVLSRDREDKSLKKYLGGAGINLRLARDLIPQGVDPLAPENAVILGAGSVVGASVPGANKVLVTTKYPMTGTIGTGVAGMAFAGQMKWAGLDHLAVKGRSPKPVYLLITDDRVAICDASSLWGRDVYETTDFLRKKHSPQASVLAIGAAGENLVSLSLAMVDKVSSIGKGGLGAVLGSKNLKAVVALGTGGTRPADPQGYEAAVGPVRERIRNFSPRLQWVEEGIMRKWEYRAAGFIHKNWTRSFPLAEATELYGPEVYHHQAKKGRVACLSCPIAEKEILQVREGPFAGMVTYAGNFPGRVGNWGIRCGVGGYDRVVKCQDLANRSGLCAHSASALIDFALELYEQNILTNQDTGGLELKRDFATVHRLLEMIIAREGLGEVLGDGYQGLIRRFGGKVEEQAQHMKFMDFQKDARKTGLDSTEFAQVVNPRGGRHQSGGSVSAHRQPLEVLKEYAARTGVPASAFPRIFAPPYGFHVGRFTAHCEVWYSLMNCLGICTEAQLNQFYTLADCARIFSAVTGVPLAPEEMQSAGERVWTLLKMLNVREGFSRKDDRFPECWLDPLGNESEALFLTDNRGNQLGEEDLRTLLDGYYEEHGWDVPQGIPTLERLAELGLRYVS